MKKGKQENNLSKIKGFEEFNRFSPSKQKNMRL